MYKKIESTLRQRSIYHGWMLSHRKCGNNEVVRKKRLWTFCIDRFVDGWTCNSKFLN
jgi:hypothetical protein